MTYGNNDFQPGSDRAKRERRKLIVLDIVGTVLAIAGLAGMAWVVILAVKAR